MTQQEKERQAIIDAMKSSVAYEELNGKFIIHSVLNLELFADTVLHKLSELRKPSEYENSGKPIVVEVFADNGEHSHWSLIDSKTGDTIWEESEPIGRTDEELVQKIEKIIRSCWASETGFNRTAKEIAKLLPPRSRKNDVNVELFGAAKYFHEAWICEYSKITALRSDVDKHSNAITNAEKQMKP